MNLIAVLLFAAALMLTGELTVAPFAGVQIFTPFVLAVHVGGGAEDATVMLSVLFSTAPFASFAWTVSRWLPVAAVIAAVMVDPLTVFLDTPSTYTCICVMAALLPATASTVKGEVTVLPLLGVQIFTPLAGAVHEAGGETKSSTWSLRSGHGKLFFDWAVQVSSDT